MSLIFTAFLPHPPVLIPNIGKENLDRLPATQESYSKIKAGLITAGTDTIVGISPHGFVQQKAFTLNLHPEFRADFEDFGDFTTKGKWPGNIGLTHRIREKLETKMPLQMISQEKLDHGLSIPMHLLTGEQKIKLIPLYFSGLTLEEHFEFGRAVGHEIVYYGDQVAVIASGDLSHRLAANAPAGYSPKARRFDKKIIDYLTQNKIKEIVKIKDTEIAEAQECGLRSLVILLGILDGHKYKTELLSYEAPFGVGYLAVNFAL